MSVLERLKALVDGAKNDIINNISDEELHDRENANHESKQTSSEEEIERIKSFRNHSKSDETKVKVPVEEAEKKTEEAKNSIEDASEVIIPIHAEPEEVEVSVDVEKVSNEETFEESKEDSINDDLDVESVKVETIEVATESEDINDSLSDESDEEISKTDTSTEVVEIKEISIDDSDVNIEENEISKDDASNKDDESLDEDNSLDEDDESLDEDNNSEENKESDSMTLLEENNIYSMDDIDKEFTQKFVDAGLDTVDHCFQCGTCGGGCPSGRRTPYKVRQIVRKCLLGLKEDVISDPALWMCTTCYTCQERCPRSVEIVEIIKMARNQAAHAGYMADAHKATGSFVIKTGHGVPINDATKSLRKSIGLDELPPSVHSFPDQLKEVQNICEACGFDKLIGYNMETGELE